MITFDEQNQIFYLESSSVSYIMKLENRRLRQLYFGARIPCEDVSGLRVYFNRGFAAYPDGRAAFSPDAKPYEYAGFGGGDFRTPAIVAESEGNAVTDFVYTGYRIARTKPKLDGLPCLREGETLVIELLDEGQQLGLELFYTVYDEGAVAKSARITALGEKPVLLSRVMSGGLDIERGGAYEILELTGRHCFERQVGRVKLGNGIYSLSSLRGASSHQRNPFLALVRPDATEESGEVFGFNLVYSGNFLFEAERDQSGAVRVLGGMHPLTTRFTLTKGQSAQSPELVAVYSPAGLGGMSRAFHDLYRTKLINPRFATKPRPVVINNWESTYFDFDEEKIAQIAADVRGTGIDMLVLDDGWFGRRDDDWSSLGDWVVNRKKLPNGLHKIIECCKTNGLKFGLWFEPEMVSPDSDLYRAHPEYTMAVEGRQGCLGRNQLVLDFSRTEVVDAIYGQIKAVLTEYPDIAYIKWDMNRHLTDVPELHRYHDYVLGVYRLYERLNEAFPDVLIEGCSGGGGRFDAGILYYSPQIWTSDNSDAFARTFIQYGTSLCYPLSSMSNHVSIVPNHQTGRVTPFASRGDIASLGALGYELNPAMLSSEEKRALCEQIAAYRQDEALVLAGDLYRLRNPFDSENFCWQVAAKDGSRALLVYMRAHDMCGEPVDIVYPRGLHANRTYRVRERGLSYSGQTLMAAGIAVHPEQSGDYVTVKLHLDAIDGI